MNKYLLLIIFTLFLIKYFFYYPLPFCFSLPPYSSEAGSGLLPFDESESKNRVKCVTNTAIKRDNVRYCLYLSNPFATDCFVNYIDQYKSALKCDAVFVKDRFLDKYYSSRYKDYYNLCITESVLRLPKYDLKEDWCNKIVGGNFTRDWCYISAGMLFKEKVLCDKISKPKYDSENNSYKVNYNKCVNTQ